MSKSHLPSPNWGNAPPIKGFPLGETRSHHAMPYLEALWAFAFKRPGRFHAPAHKGGAGADPALLAMLGSTALALDVRPGVAGVDVGAESTPFDQAEALAAAAHLAERTWFLVNGASQGVQAACLAVTHQDQTVLVQRDSHISVIHGLVLSGARASYLQPEFDPQSGLPVGVSPEHLRAQLATVADVTTVVLTSPSYFGAVGRIAECIDIAHAAGAVVIVDQSWGSHFGFHERLPQSALKLGADVVVTSTHKSLGSLTQSAMLHLGRDSQVPVEAIDRALALVSSTSQSALLRASLDIARHRIVTEGEQLLEHTLQLADRARQLLALVPGCQVVRDSESLTWDPLRVVVDLGVVDCDGMQIAERLRKESDLHVALATRRHLVLALGLQEPVEPLLKFGERLTALVSSFPLRGHVRTADPIVPVAGYSVMPPRAAYLASTDTVNLPDAVDRIAAATVSCYPPGTVVIAPGEIISELTVTTLMELQKAGHRIQGLQDAMSIAVVSDNAFGGS